MRSSICLLLPAALLGLVQTALAADAVTHFRLAPDSANSASCSILDPILGRRHNLTLAGGDAELTSAGGIEGHMRRLRPGVYGITFELDRRRLNVIAELAPEDKTLVVTEDDHHCRWVARSE